MKKFFSYLGVGIVPCAIFALLFFTGQFDACSDRRTTDGFTQVEINQAKRQVADSINRERDNRELAKLDSTAGKYRGQIKRLKSDYRDLEQLIASQVEGIEEDTTRSDCSEFAAKCDSALTTYAQYADTLRKTIEVQSSLIANRDSAISINLQKYRKIETSYSGAKLDVQLLQDKLASKSTWWKRNEKWIYFIGGVVGTGLLLK